ncbi:DUF2971 domain-containing protein [Pelolinea submarina]|uniref:DUF2971 family protein n=1 Tax=Pelolinea submarina TaxID=913107 RepID=A0A347ZPB5_9CHLR|nr:DUF2971 domain-containing protein [Pelolinea submarina]REG08747.1 DUF2971 family protein [Pelolinea submarina]BBB47146.1 hypothetical protein Pelsub_P0373 [Pelolinea submarina]
MKLYKYFGPDILDKAFSSKKYLSLKCGYPKDFNDPYELFLTIDFNEQPEILAFYSDIIGEIVQLPTTCFSQSPSIIPMWSHYAQNLAGFVIEINEENLAKQFPKSRFGDVDYREKPDDSLQYSLHKAFTTLKPRHTYSLFNEVLGMAYFSKNICWNYELERRMVIDPDETRESNGLILIDIPINCVSAIICGPRANLKTKEALSKQANRFKCNYFEMKIGHSSITPFFVNRTGDSYIFKEGKLLPPSKFCIMCKEPLGNTDTKVCSWCSINESNRASAAVKNPFRMLDSIGLLESYLRDMDEITQEHQKK